MHIPESWAWVSAEAACGSVRDGTHDTPDYVKSGIPLITSKNLIDGHISFDNTKLISIEDHEEISKRSGVENGDILFAMIGTIGNPVVVNSSKVFSIKNVALFKKNENVILPGYLKYWLESPDLNRWLKPRLRGTTQKFTPLGLLRVLPVPLAPLVQQHRILSEIEKQFSRLDEAVASLKRIQANLKRYKAAVLKAAVEGKLTEQWRKDHPDVEPADQLLKRILAERRAKWEAEELAKMKAKGIRPKDDSWKMKYKEPAGPDTANLPELPEGWVWATVDQLTIELMNGFGKRSQTEGSPAIVLRLADILNGEISCKDVRRINSTEEDVCKYGLLQNDLLILRVNGSSDLVGRFVLVRQLPEVALYCDHFIRARCLNSEQALWLRIYSDTKRLRRYVELNKVSSAGQNTVNQGVLSIFALPLPPVSEQLQIIAEIDRRLSVTEELEVTIETNLKRSERLRQRILSSSFKGY
jgi:type I restriction enzyme S subunit